MTKLWTIGTRFEIDGAPKAHGGSRPRSPTVCTIWLGNCGRERAAHVIGPRAQAIAPYVAKVTNRVVRVN